MAIDGHDVANDGTVEFRQKDRTSILYYIQRHQIGENVRLEVFRNGEKQVIEIKLTKPVGSGRLVPWSRYDLQPTYFIYGGLVFSPLTYDYLNLYGDDPPEYLFALLDAHRRVMDEQVVILNRVLASSLNNGYHFIEDWHVTEVNGKNIANMRDLVRIIENDKQESFVVFKNNLGALIVLNKAEVEAARENILKIYNIPSDRSEDLR